MDEIIDRVERYIVENNMAGQKESILLGVSGGADSVCLLLVMSELSAKLGFTLRVVTVEHGIRGAESVRDAEFVEKLCLEKRLPCRVIHVDAPALAAKSRQTLEEAARKLRYGAFFDVVPEGGIVATAHHANDNAETFLFNLIRGSDLRGLSGIAPVSNMKGRKIIRPLLCLERDEIEAFLQRRDQDYCVDSTNESFDHDRNRMRLSVIPELCEINIKAVSHINDAIRAIRKTAQEGEKESAKIVESAVVFKGLDARRLMFMTAAARGDIVMTWLRGELPSVKDIGRVHIDAIAELAGGRPGRGVDIPGGYRVEKTYRELVIKPAEGKTPAPEIDHRIPPLESGETYQVSFEGYDIRFALHNVSWSQGKEIPQKTYSKWFDYDKIKNGLTLRHRKTGDRIIVNRIGMHKSIKDLCRDEKIDRDMRDELMLLADGSEIVWAIGIRGSEGYLVDRTTKKILEISILRS